METIASYGGTLLIGYALGRLFSPNARPGELERRIEAQESARTADVPETYDGEDLLYSARM